MQTLPPCIIAVRIETTGLRLWEPSTINPTSLLSISVVDVNSELPRQNLAVKAAEAAFIPKIEELHEKLLKICRKSPRAKSAEEVDLILSELIPEGTVLVSSTARWQSPWIQRYLPKFSAKLNPQYVDIEELSRTLSVLGYAVPDAPPQIQSNSLQKAELDAERFRGLMKNLCPSTST